MHTLFGTKIGMTQVFSEEGNIIPVTAIEVLPNLVVDIEEKEGRGKSVIIGYGNVTRDSLLNKPFKGQFVKKGLELRRKLMTVSNITSSKLSVGDLLSIKDCFQTGDLVDIQGTTRGHGFTGAIKLWNFAIGPRSHGAGFPHRYQGSLETGRGGSAAQKVWKGKKMAGRYGNETVTMIALEVVGIIPEKNILLIKGSIPGRKKRIVRIRVTNRIKKRVSSPVKLLRNA